MSREAGCRTFHELHRGNGARLDHPLGGDAFVAYALLRTRFWTVTKMRSHKCERCTHEYAAQRKFSSITFASLPQATAWLVQAPLVIRPIRLDQHLID
jgi:hypothetical protein